MDDQPTIQTPTAPARAPRVAHWRLIAWNGKSRAGYVVLNEGAPLAFTQNWRQATVLPTREAWEDTRDKVRAMGADWSSTPLNAPRRPKAEVAA